MANKNNPAARLLQRGVLRRHQGGAAAGMRRQRGAAAVFAAISIIAALAAIGLALDLGRLYYAQRDLQRLANMAALDSVRVASGCMGDVPSPGAAALSEAQASVSRNGGSDTWVKNSSTDIIGRMLSSEGIRSFEVANDVRNRAVRVKLSRQSPNRLIPLYSGIGTTATLTALSAAYETPSALVQIGSRLLTFDPPDGSALNRLFTGLLGGPVSLDVLSYQHLFDAEISLLGIRESLDIGPEDFDAPVALRGVIGAVMDQLSGSAKTAAQAMYDAAGTSKTVVPNDMGLGDTSSGGMVSAGQFIASAGQLSLGDALVSLPVTIPAPLGDGTTVIHLVEPGAVTRLLPGGVLADAENFAHNASVAAVTTVPIDLSAITSIGKISFFVQAGYSSAQVDSINCARRGQPQDKANVTATSSIARLGIGQFDNINLPNPTPEALVLDSNGLLKVLGIPLPVHLRVRIKSFVDINQSDSDHFDNMVAGETRRLGTPSTTAIATALSRVPANLEIQIEELKVIGSLASLVPPLLLNAVQAQLNNVLNQTRTTLQTAITNIIKTNLLPQMDAVLMPQMQALGVTIGGADVYVAGIAAEQPLLFTH